MSLWYEQPGWIVAITGGASTLLTLACTKGVDALLKIRKARADEQMAETQQEAGHETIAFQEAKAAYDKLREALEARVIALETALKDVGQELKESRKDHMNCAVEQERLRGELKAMQVHVDRLWKHDQANQENVAGLKERLAKDTAAQEGT